MAERANLRNSSREPTDPYGMLPAPPPYDAWAGNRFDAPHSALVERAPAPLSEASDRARRSVEFGPELGIAVPHCPSAVSAGCPSLTAGSEVGLTLLVRPTPYFAFGASARRFAFGLGGRAGASEARGSALFLGLSGRVYLLESGFIDPHLELDLGGGSLSLDVRDRGTPIEEQVAFSFAARSAAGVDFMLNSWLRVGTFLAITRFVPASVAHCEPGGCSARSAGSSWLAVGATSLGVRVSFAAGELL